MELVAGSMLMGVAIFAYLHLLVLFSLYMGRSATPMTLTVSFAAGWLYVYGTYSQRISTTGAIMWFMFSTLVFFGVIAALQRSILHRLESLAATA
jgi:hypothetical protein